MTKRIYDVVLNSKGYIFAPGIGSSNSSIVTPFAPKQVSGDYSLADFEQYSIVAQSNLQGGMGQLRYATAEKFLWAYRVDTRGERVTLGPKLQSSQPTSRDANGMVGVLDAAGDMLNLGMCAEPEDQTRTWVTLDAGTTKIAVPFTTPGGGSFTPTDLSGLKLWLKADTGVYQDSAGTTPVASNNDPVGKWTDQSGQGNHFTQATAGSRPTYKTNVQNSLPGIAGDAAADYLSGTAPITGSGNRTLIIVYKAGHADSTHYDLDLGYNSAAGGDWSLSSKLGVHVTSGSREWNAAKSTANYEIVTIRQEGSNTNILQAWVDGVSKSATATTAQAISTANTGATIFTRNPAGGYSSSTICEILLYDSALSTTDREQVEAYLGTRYNISVTSSGSGNYKLQRLWAYVRSLSGISASTLNYSVNADSSGSPGAAVTNGTTANATVTDISYQGGWLSLSCGTLMSTLTAATQYWLVVNFTVSGNESLDVLTASDSDISDVYKTYNGSTWAAGTTATAAIVAQYVNLHPDTPPVKFIEWDNFVYALAGKRVYKLTSPTTMSVANDGSGIKALASDITDGMLVQKTADTAAKMLVAMGTGTDITYWDGVTTWTAVTNIKADRLTQHDNLFWRAANDTTNGVFVMGTSDYADWTTAGTGGPKARIGDRRYPVVALFSWKGNLYAGKQDGLYAITYSDTYPAAAATIQANKLLDFSGEIHENTFSAWAVFQDDLYFPLANGLARYSSSNVLSSVSPEVGLLEQAQQRGRFSALTGTLGQLYALFESSESDWSQVLAYTGTGWHGLATTDRTGDPGKALLVDSGVFSDSPRIWLSSHCIVSSFVQPTWTTRRWTYSDRTSASEVQFFTRDSSTLAEVTGRLYTSWIDGDLLNVPKYWAEVDVVGANLSTSVRYLAVYYRTEETADFTLLTNVTTEPVQTVTIGVSSRKLQLRFDFISTQSYDSPQMLGYALRYTARPDVQERFQFQVVLAKGLRLHNGAVDLRSLATQKSDLKAARQAQTAVTLIDEEGTSYSVHLDQLGFQRQTAVRVNDSEYDVAWIATVGATEA